MFWPWISQNIPLCRMYFCDPPGRSDPDSLYNYGHDLHELHYIYFHDQEPIHFDLHRPLFNEVAERSRDLDFDREAFGKAVITSEHNSEFVEQICEDYGWRQYYYFFHGWAAMDWYRGYNRSWLMPKPEDRTMERSFICPTRIIGGKRDHRVLLMYQFIKQQIENAWLSCPRTCPVENINIEDIAAKFSLHYPDIEQTLKNADLPWQFPGETDHPMHSCWLSLFNECAESLAYVVTETVFSGRRHHLTEKSFKPICLQMPFILVAPQGSLEYLKLYGFRTFDDFWDESYDQEPDDYRRLEKVAELCKKIDSMTAAERTDMYKAMMPIIEHNYNHFYDGGFETVLWTELEQMLEQIQKDFKIKGIDR